MMRPAYKRPAHVHPAHVDPTHVTPDNEVAMDAMPTKRRAVEEALAIEVAAIRPSPAIPVMPPTWPAMDFVDEVGVFDGVTQAVGATERNGSGGLAEQAGSRNGCSCKGQCECPHGVTPGRTCRPPLPSHVRSIL